MCTAAVAMLHNISDPVDGEVLEDALGQAFVALYLVDWKSHVLLFRPFGFGVLLWSGSLQATADVILCFAGKAVPFTWGGCSVVQIYNACLTLCWINH